MRPRVSVSFVRALALRCPRCGGRGILKSWFQLRPQCPTCALAFERGEDEDYWYGGFMFNIIAAELLSMGAVVIAIVATFPRVPWTALEMLGPALAVVVPVVTYPFTRCIWLAWDLAFRPAEPGD
ncbi:MAG: DUF983 domain-containing protein [Gemmatimonadota bacterium]|nr:DUF983 domain-containing protein [Gemmatimonadota bacterium]